MRGIGKQMGSLGKTGGAVFKSIAAGAAIAAAAITTAFGLAAKFAKSAIQAAIEDDAEQQKLIATLKARGQTTEQATKRVNALIEAGAKLAFTDSEVRKGYEVATRFANKYSNQQKILTTAQDLARSSNISLEAATKIVGKAFDGSGKALKNYGIELEKGVRGTKALDEINKKVGGVAEQFAKTFEGQFRGVRIAIDETVESIGFAIGGGEGLPTFTRLLEGIRPVLDDLIGEINANLPKIERFGRELVEKFLAKLPGYVATAKRELPILIDKATKFIGSVAGFGKEIASFLGPDGLVTAGIAGLGFKFGGLGGAAGAVFASEFIKLGVDPITATIASTIAGAITAGVVNGLASQLAMAAVSKFLAFFSTSVAAANIGGAVASSVTSGVSTAVAAPAIVASGVTLASTLALAIPAAIFAASALAVANIATAFQKAVNPTGNTGPSYIPSYGGGAPMAPVNGGGGGYLAISKSLTDGAAKGVADGLAPVSAYLGRDINFTNKTTLEVDGRVLAQTVDNYLGPMYRSGGLPRGGLR
jgi:hypothetical protein